MPQPPRSLPPAPDVNPAPGVSRRTFLGAGLALGTGLVAGCQALRLGNASGAPDPVPDPPPADSAAPPSTKGLPMLPQSSASWRRHAGLDPRNGFLPPRLMVPRLTASGWSAVPPVPFLSDPYGEQPRPRDVALQVAWEPGKLHLRGRCAAPIVADSEQPDGDRNLWRQDHVDLRLLPDPTADAEAFVTMVAPGPKVWDSAGLREAGRLQVSGEFTPDAWTFELVLDLGGFDSPASAYVRRGAVLRGILSHSSWRAAWQDVAAVSPIELGTNHSERYADFELVEARDVGLRRFAPSIRAVGLGTDEQVFRGGPAQVELMGVAHGTLRVTTESGEQAASRLEPIVDGQAQFPLDLTRRAFTRLSFSLVETGADLGAVTLRAGVQPEVAARVTDLTHPYLYFRRQDLPGLRARLGSAEFQERFGRVRPQSELLTQKLPDPADRRAALALNRQSAGWYRVAKESMLRDGAGDLRPASARWWALQSPAAHRAWRRLRQSVGEDRDALETVIGELNGLLARRDVYTPEAFDRVSLPPEGEALRARREALTDDETFLFNRILLSCSIECVHSVYGKLYAEVGPCAEAWLLTEDRRYVDRATEFLYAANELAILDSHLHLHEGGACRNLAIAWDVMAPVLSAADRDVWLAAARRFFELHHRTAAARSWTVVCVPNANPVGNGGVGLLALAFLRELPELAERSLFWTRKYIHTWLDYCHGRDGGNTEGAQYWDYGGTNGWDFATVCERVTGDDEGLLSHPAFEHAMNMVRLGLCPDGAMHGVNDTIPVPVAGTLAWLHAQRWGDDFALWYADHAVAWFQREKAAGRQLPYRSSAFAAAVHRPRREPPAEAPAFPVALTLESVQVSTLRSAPRFDCALAAGLKGSRPPYTHHNQADAGSIWVHADGDRLLIDPGYYKGEATDHCLPLLNGQGPREPTLFTGRMLDCGAAGELRWALGDFLGAYAHLDLPLARCRRLLVMCGDEGLVLLDDLALAADAEPLTVTSQFQGGGPGAALADGRSYRLRGQRSGLRLDLLTGDATFAAQPERSLHDTHWGYHFAECRLCPVLAECRVGPGDPPLVTGILRDPDGTAGGMRAELAEGALRVQLPSGNELQFRLGADGWELVR